MHRGPHPAGDRPITETDRAEVRETFERYAGRGLRVLGFAQRKVAQVEDGERDLIESDLCFVGLAALPIRPDPRWPTRSRAASEPASGSIVVTGDHALTAEAIAREVGIVDGRQP